MTAPEIFDVTVDEKCIENGRPWEGQSCPVALAVRALGAVHVHVSRNVALVQWNLVEPDVTYVHNGASFTRDFDDGYQVEPTTVHFKRLLR